MAINRGRYNDKSALEDDKDELIKVSLCWLNYYAYLSVLQ